MAIVAGTILDNGGELRNVKHPDYGAVGNGIADDTVPIQTALDATSPGGGIVFIPPGVYRLTAALTIPPRCTLRGAGMVTSVLKVDHDGDCLHSLAAINSSTPVYINVEMLALVCERETTTGAGYADTGGTFVNVDRVLAEGFKYGILFDQTEIATIQRSYVLLRSWTTAGIWLVNGPAHTVGANPGFTNGISIRDTEFNAGGEGFTGVQLLDDGGANHTIESCNFNAGRIGIYAAGVKGLTIANCASESVSDASVQLDTLASDTSNVGPCQAVTIRGNTYSDAIPYQIKLLAGLGGTIEGNMFGAYTTSGIVISSDRVAQFAVRSNAKLIRGAFRTAGVFLDATAVRLAAQSFTQKTETYVAAAIAAGVRTVTPATMGYPASTEAIVVGSKLLGMNEDGSNAEYVTVTAVAATTFTATFASAKAANWLVVGL